jgi:hypothetical protein
MRMGIRQLSRRVALGGRRLVEIELAECKGNTSLRRCAELK